MWALGLLSGEGEDSPFPTPASPRASLHSERSGSPDAWRLSAPSTGPPPLQGVGSGFLLLVLEASPSMTRAHSCRLASWGQPRKALTQPPQFTRRERPFGVPCGSHMLMEVLLASQAHRERQRLFQELHHVCAGVVCAVSGPWRWGRLDPGGSGVTPGVAVSPQCGCGLVGGCPMPSSRPSCSQGA